MTEEKKELNLREYMEKTGISQAKLARRAGISTGTIFLALRGQEMKLETAIRLEDATEGKITCRQLYLEQQQAKKGKKEV